MSCGVLAPTHCSAKRLCQALALAAPALAATASADAKEIFLHLKTERLSLWLFIPTLLQGWSNVNQGGTAGDLAFTLPALDPAMGMSFLLPDGTTLSGADSNMAMGGLSVDNLGGDPMATASWSLWITGSVGGLGWGIHLINFPALLALPFGGANPDGQLNYALHGASIPMLFNVTRDGQPDMPVQEFASDIEWTSDARIPTPGAFALIGVGALATLRRRRS